MATHSIDPPPSPEATLAETHLDAHLDNAPTEPVLEDHPSDALPQAPIQIPLRQAKPPSMMHRNPFLTTTQATLHAFPSLEPTRFATYPSTHLLVPLRRDILHRAVIYEGDATRQGTASTKWRSEVHGSNRKIRPQKGTGSARLGDKKSPMLKGGGVAFGPKPRDFATGLPRRIYDLAWRTALSYRYRMGQLILLDGEVDFEPIGQHSRARYLRDMLQYNRMGKGDGRTLFVTLEKRDALDWALDRQGGNMGMQAQAKDVEDVDVKDLLGLGRIVMEKKALDEIFKEHQSDLSSDLRLGPWKMMMQAQGIAPDGQPNAVGQ